MRVLLASDGSGHARRAARWLRDLTLPSDTKISVLTVATLTEPPRDSQTMRELRDSLVTEARQTGETTAKILRPRWSAVETVVTQGDPSVEVVHVAEESGADMVALGARGLGAVKRFFVGSTSVTVARYAPCPVAIFRGQPRRVRNVLVATDGSEGARAALRFLAIFELVRDSHVVLLHVVQEPGGHRPKPGADEDEVLADAVTVLAEVPYAVERVVVEGDPARQIVATARSRNVDLMVLGARGLGAIGRLLLGSVSETVLHHAGWPVMIVRDR
jgi:nucleotide-binding universal stress UspA family protein